MADTPLSSLSDELAFRLNTLELATANLLTRSERLTTAFDSNAMFFADRLEQLSLLMGKVSANQLPFQQKIKDLSDVEFRVFSQWGEDGIIEWLITHLPPLPERFVEFGVGTFNEANCRFLLLNRNWKGLIMDGDEAQINQVKGHMLSWRQDLTALSAFITIENIDRLISSARLDGEIGLLSVDIDGNDYWVWEAIESVNPAIVITEYNAVFGDLHAVSVPYHPSFTRFDGHPSGLYFGASLGAMRHLADRKGYEFLGTNRHGINAFFVRKDLAHHVLPFIERARAFPSRHRDSRDENGRLNYTSGIARYDLIKHLPVIEVTTGQHTNLQQLGPAFSEEWLAGMI